ncbi:helix-turn-helix domain-containing protein [Sphingomonas cavernae]|uniref:DNA-binding protein n=1 Tax=Sphingomonas cavernae TaxID=2320861 RepID=A0A418WJW2_9SPHN|nr:helix-turn-helix domain-containing protein [Sphingomonas cavernae]RJF90324.1 DNA-binding protein [Sphingomonas cavernae]
MKRRQQSHRATERVEPNLRPISVRIPVAVKLTGISRSKLYELIKDGSLQTVKVGSSTLIPIDSLERFIDANRS